MAKNKIAPRRDRSKKGYEHNDNTKRKGIEDVPAIQPEIFPPGLKLTTAKITAVILAYL